MGLRAKLAAWLWALLACAILAVSVASLDRALRVMVQGLIVSGDQTVAETFEQIRDAVLAGGRDPGAALRGDRGLRTAIESAHAFGEYVVYVRIVSPDGTVIVAAPPDTEGHQAQAAPDIGWLKRSAASSFPLALLPPLWADRTYDVSAPVDLDGRPFGLIRVGLSTGLIAADVHRLVMTMIGIAIVALILSSLAAAVVGDQLLRPVQALVTGVDRLARGSGEVTLELGGHDELSSLADKFNQLSRRVWAERTRWETERGRLVGAFRSITDAVLLIDASGALLFANAVALSRLALRGKGEGKPLGLLLGAHHPLMQLVAPALAAGTEVHDVALELRNDGLAPERFLVSIFSLGQGQISAGLLVILRDLEHVNELEAVVDYSSRLVRLGGLLSGVAHQIRAPLNVMSAQLQLLRREAEEGKSVERRIERLRREITRLDEAIDALMRFMRPQELKAEEIPLNELLTQIGKGAAQPDIKVEYELDSELGSVVGDRALLGEALRNIVQNGVQAMPGGGALTIRSLRSAEGYVEIEIVDRGVGIAAESRERIFDLYFTTKDGGSGLGLPLALRAIDLHHGSIDIESRPGAGTTVRVRLPGSASAKALVKETETA